MLLKPVKRKAKAALISNKTENPEKKQLSFTSGLYYFLAFLSNFSD